MHSVTAIALGLLAGSASAIIANFDQSNINLNNYQSASFPDFTIVPQTYKTSQGSNLGIIANTPENYLKSADKGYGIKVPSNGSLAFTQSTYGHLNSYYYACYDLGAFVPVPAKCNFTMTATCKDKNGATFYPQLYTQFTKTDRTMQFQDLSGFYQYFATAGQFCGNGAQAACTRYDFQSVNADPQGGPLGFFIDTMSYSVTNVIN